MKDNYPDTEPQQFRQDRVGVRLESVLDRLSGPREEFRQMLSDAPSILARVCRYAERKAKRKNLPAWVIISDLTAHGSGVSSAIYELYRLREDVEPPIKGAL